MNNIKKKTTLLDNLSISPLLRARIQQRITCDDVNTTIKAITSSSQKNDVSSFVLYIPTVNLRIDQNPAFALACHIANHLHLPLIVLAVLLDDHSMPCYRAQHHKEVTMTARRLAFLTEALSQASQQWSDHGAGVAIRVHKHKSRIPDHLTMSSRAAVVVTDEPFVHPYLNFVLHIENVCHKHSVPCFRVDGSTTVPPRSILRLNTGFESRSQKNQSMPSHDNATGGTGMNNTNHIMNNDDTFIYYHGVPTKAWIWQKQTESYRHDQLQAAMDGDFDPPILNCTIDDHNFFISSTSSTTTTSSSQQRKQQQSSVSCRFSPLIFPSHWRNENNEAPGLRPWTVSELTNVMNTYTTTTTTTVTNENENTRTNDNITNYTSIKKWAMEWPGSDSSVKPCLQTIGTTKAGMQRWNYWVRQRKGLLYYAKRRTDPLQPHASSRMSCYLNFGIVSIFRIVYEVKAAQRSNSSNGVISGADKFEEEIVKWREMSYAHSFSRGDYNSKHVVPVWAQKWLNEKYQSQSQSQLQLQQQYDLNRLENYDSGDVIWDAMQRYLVSTGELHNNVRMTWGKKLVHWNHAANNHGFNNFDPITNLLHVLCYLNDRFALDGLSPPSYAGLLWCIGWTDKPDRKGGISTKRIYKLSPQGFQDAEKNLMNEKASGSGLEQTRILSKFNTSSGKDTSKRRSNELNEDDDDIEISKTSTPKKMKKADKKTLLDFFKPPNK